MEGVILTLCLALTCVLVGILWSGGRRCFENYERLRSEMEDGKNAPRTILVKQSAGELKLVYSIEPQGKVFQKDLARELAVIRAAQEREIFPQDEIAVQDSYAKMRPCVAEHPGNGRAENGGEMRKVSESEKDVETEKYGETENGGAEGTVPPQETEVLFKRSEKLGFAEKYNRMEQRARELLDEFDKYIRSIPFCEKKTQAGGLVFRYKKEIIAKAGVQRGVATLEFHILNPELGRMLREEHLKSMKVAPARIRLTGEKELLLAEKTADLTVRFLQNEENYQRDKRKLARREAARRKRAEGETIV